MALELLFAAVCFREIMGYVILKSYEGSETGEVWDEHAFFNNAVREFNCTLLEQFQISAEESKPMEFEEEAVEAALNTGKEPYLARFSQPFPVRPMWAAMPRPQHHGATLLARRPGMESPWASDYTCQPLVCVVLRDSPNARETVRGALRAMAAHPVGLLVTVNSVAPEAHPLSSRQSPCHQAQVEPGGNGLLLFAAVGLRWPRTDPDRQNTGEVIKQASTAFIQGTGGVDMEDQMMSKADQREMVWAAVHQALQDEDGKMPDVVVEVFMLQDVWLYDRLFRWVTRNRGTCSRETFTRQISQQELDLLVHEFGEETATHFLFVEHYTRHLRVAAVISLLAVAISLLTWLCNLADKEYIEDGMRAVLSFFLPAWGFHFLASWRSTASKAGFRWQGSLGSVQNSVKEVARLQAVESNEAKYIRFLRVALLTVPLMLLQLAVVLIVTVSFVCMEVYIYDVTWAQMTSLGHALALLVYNISFGVAFIIMLACFHPISKAVTTLERHPDKDLQQWHLTTKIFGNWFFLVFLYFFVIAFCYIPFGDHIADFCATFLAGEGNTVLRTSLQKFRPDIERLATDVLMFFLIQDAGRLVQILLPVLRGAWGIGQLRGPGKGKRNRSKRTAIFFKACGMFRVFCKRGRRRKVAIKEKEVSSNNKVSTSPARDGGVPPRDGAEALLPEVIEHSEEIKPRAESLTGQLRKVRGLFPQAMRRKSAMSLLLPRFANVPKAPPAPRQPGDVYVAYCYLGRMQIQRNVDINPEEEVVMAACGLAAGGSVMDFGNGEFAECPQVPTRLRACYASDSDPGWLEEDENEDLGDLITLTCDDRSISERTSTEGDNVPIRSVRLNIYAEIIHKSNEGGASPLMRGDSISSSSWRFHEEAGAAGVQGGISVIDLELPPASTGLESPRKHMPYVGVAKLGPVRVSLVAGIVRGATHAEALERVPRSFRLASCGLMEDPSEEPCLEVAAAEEAALLALNPLRGVPFLWWDADLQTLYWDEIYELFAVRETFETFEIYAHLTTQFSYICLFGIAVPIIPLLALIFTSMEVRQDQLRLLWLSRPPHPDRETFRFKGTVSVGAWYEIIKFTCHMSVAVNLLLWGLTYAGASSVLPADWTAVEWWRALSLFSLCQQACYFLSGMLHRTVSQLDQPTAKAYLRRYNRLKRMVTGDPATSLAAESSGCRQVQHEQTRRQLTRATSQGLSALM